MKKRSPKAVTRPAGNDSYLSLLADIKERVSQAQVRAHLAVSRELILLYWSIGRDIVTRQKTEGWGKAVTNFKITLPSPQSDLAQQIVKDPYNFGFLTLGHDARELELELGLIEHLSKFLVELGTGFAFVGRQVHLDVGGEDFYLNVVDDQKRHPDDQPSIGLILCQDKKNLVAEYALRGMTKAIGISEYQLTRKLPKKLKGSLPTIEEIEAELSK